MATPLAFLLLAAVSSSHAEATAYLPHTRTSVLAAAYESGTPVQQALEAEPPMPELAPYGAARFAGLMPRIAAIQSPQPAADCAAMGREIDEVTATVVLDEAVRPTVAEMYKSLKGCSPNKSAGAFWTQERDYRRAGFARSQAAQRAAYERNERVQKRLAGVDGSVFGKTGDPGAVGAPSAAVQGSAGNGAKGVPASAYLPSAEVPASIKHNAADPPPLTQAGANPSVNREVMRVLAIAQDSVCRLNRQGLRSAGSGEANGILNNTLSTFTDRIRCYPQSEEVVADLKKWGVGGPASPWQVEIRNKEGWKPASDAEAETLKGRIKTQIYNNGHWWVRLKPKDPSALPVVVNIDPWAGIYSVDPPDNVKPREQWQVIPTADQKDCQPSLPSPSP
ncbi:MAG: hypothetical protein NTY77_16660 [Elusimicrobia bacterium]|nr:hypothetical protein [Elusimicrobiota bacterium]